MKSQNKIKDTKDLKTLISKLKKQKKKIVLCHGVFDILHFGHIKHFEDSKKLGDILIISLTADNYVKKGPGRPYFNNKVRSEFISNLALVDYVVVNNSSTAVDIIKHLEPDIYCKGVDYRNSKKDITGKIKDEIKAIKSVKGSIEFTDNIVFSSSKIINKIISNQSSNKIKFIRNLNKKFSIDVILKYINDFKKLKVLVLGEIIIDHYVFCEALGKSGKEPVLVLRELNEQKYLGGSAAIANHLADFCKSVKLIGSIGEKKEYDDYIKKNLKKNITPYLVTKKNSPTIVKKRFIDNVSNNKSLGVYKINDKELSPSEEIAVINYLKKNIHKYDLVIVSDYGHGFITQKIASLISSKSKFLSLNAQINAANISYQSLNKYNKADFLIINENEIRNQLRDKNSDLKFLMRKLCKDFKINILVVTKGKDGAYYYDKRLRKFHFCPAFAENVIDKIGAGDAMLPLLSMAIKNKINQEISLLLGSIGASISVESIGNSKSINKVEYLKNIMYSYKI